MAYDRKPEPNDLKATYRGRVSKYGSRQIITSTGKPVIQWLMYLTSGQVKDGKRERFPVRVSLYDSNYMPDANDVVEVTGLPSTVVENARHWNNVMVYGDDAKTLCKWTPKG